MLVTPLSALRCITTPPLWRGIGKTAKLGAAHLAPGFEELPLKKRFFKKNNPQRGSNPQALTLQTSSLTVRLNGYGRRAQRQYN